MVTYVVHGIQKHETDKSLTVRVDTYKTDPQIPRRTTTADEDDIALNPQVQSVTKKAIAR